MHKNNFVMGAPEKLIKRFWKIVCEKNTKEIFAITIPVGQISEDGIKLFVRALISKYALSDNEILQQHLKRNTKRYKNYVDISRFQELRNGKVLISFSSNVSSIHVSAWLV